LAARSISYRGVVVALTRDVRLHIEAGELAARRKRRNNERAFAAAHLVEELAPLLHRVPLAGNVVGLQRQADHVLNAHRRDPLAEILGRISLCECRRRQCRDYQNAREKYPG